jgi:hypothetical protein
MRLCLLLTALMLAAPATAAAKRCDPVKNPYPGTQYDGVDLTKIRTNKASCRTARRVARKAHYKAVWIGTSQGPIVRLTWHGWRVRGDLRPDHDPYIARKGTRWVRWRF